MDKKYIKIAEINDLLKTALRTNSVTLNIETLYDRNKAAVIFEYLLKTYEVVDKRDKETPKKWYSYWTIKTNSGYYFLISSKSDYRKNRPTVTKYTIEKI